jgi:hypothetical protein
MRREGNGWARLEKECEKRSPRYAATAAERRRKKRGEHSHSCSSQTSPCLPTSLRHADHVRDGPRRECHCCGHLGLHWEVPGGIGHLRERSQLWYSSADLRARLDIYEPRQIEIVSMALCGDSNSLGRPRTRHVAEAPSSWAFRACPTWKVNHSTST